MDTKTNESTLTTIAETDGGSIHNPKPSWWQSKRVVQTKDGDLIHVTYPDGIERATVIGDVADLPGWMDAEQTVACLSVLRRGLQV